MKRIAFTAAAAALFIAPAAIAQDAGVTIVGNDGNAVGTVASNDGTTVVVDTGTHQVPLGTAAFAEREGAWTLNTTKAELDTTYANMVAQQEAALAAALVVGAPVVTADAQSLGTIEEIKADAIVLATGEDQMALPLNLFALDQSGSVMVLASLADIQAALAAAQAG